MSQELQGAQCAEGTVLPAAAMPAPDALIDYGMGGVCCAMLHYAEAEKPVTDLIRDNGFEPRFVRFSEHEPDEPVALFLRKISVEAQA